MDEERMRFLQLMPYSRLTRWRSASPRQEKGQSAMASQRKATEPAESALVEEFPDIDSIWDAADEIEGAEPTDKAELIDIPFIITGARFFVQSSNGASAVELEARYRTGELFAFQDTSTTGVRAQVIEHLTEKMGVSDPLGAGPDHWFDMKLKASNGLRVSKYTVDVPVKGDKTGKTVAREAKTYYIRSNGVRSTRVRT